MPRQGKKRNKDSGQRITGQGDDGLRVWQEFAARLFARGLEPSEVFKELCERGLTFDVAYAVLRDLAGVRLTDILEWSEREGWFEEGGWARKIEEAYGMLTEGRLLRRAMDGSVAAMKAYLVKWRPQEWSERLAIEHIGEQKPQVLVILGYEPADMKGKQLPAAQVVEFKALPTKEGEGHEPVGMDRGEGQADA